MYPVDVDVIPPKKFERMQLLLRVAFAIAIGYIGLSMGWLWCALYLALPVIAAIGVSQKGSDGYLAEYGPNLSRVLEWVIALFAYMLLVVDRFPTGTPREELRIAIHPAGRPSVGGALARLLTSIPVALVLWLLGLLSALLWLVAAICVLFSESYPAAIHRFQLGYLRCQARLLAYHASLVDVYPQLSFHDEPLPQQPA
jgi:hypothetical protein